MPKSPVEESAPVRLALVASEFNYDVTMMMLERAREEASFLHSPVTRELRVPGVYDMPLAVSKLLRSPEVDAVVTLGAVIEGETKHDEVVMNQASRKLLDLSVEAGKPVALGISGPGESRLQAQDRIDRAALAVQAAVKMARRLREL
jgi:6,7-dimethyl-8-ribityllumazine synthase